ncbi:hypothetical protein BHM03_00053942, partial [Ensete ventricosum]
MLHPGVTQEWVGEGELPRERTKNRRWQRPYDVLAKTTHGEVVVRRRVFHVCASKLASDGSLGHQHMGAMYHQGRSQIASISESYGGDLIIQRCKAMDSRAMGLAVPWYHRGVLDQGKQAIRDIVPFLLRGVDDKGDGED